MVETVAHARAAAKFVPNASFILDIGGQDMKAIWLDRGSHHQHRCQRGLFFRLRLLS